MERRSPKTAACYSARQEMGRGFGKCFEGGLCHEEEVVEVVGISLIILYQVYLHVLCCNE